MVAQSPFIALPPPTETPVVMSIAPKAVTQSKTVLCSCVLYLKAKGIDIHGNAWDIQPNVSTKFARVGDVVLLSYNIGHVALITNVAEPTPGNILLTIDESNFHKCTPDTRIIALADLHVRGVYRPD